MEDKIIYLLIGPKGSGKSFIGTLLERNFNIKFIRVEDWAKEIKQGRSVDNEAYLNDVFQAIENGIRNELRNHNLITFESTGLTDQFDKMLVKLQNDFKVVLIKVKAGFNTCLERVKSRDQSIHINISDDQVTAINKKVLAKDMMTDFVIDNNSRDREQLMRDIEKILKSNISGNL